MLGDVADILRLRGSEGWLVGGSVRDRLLGRYAPDLDVVVADDAAAVAKQVATKLHVPSFALSERYPTYRVLGPDGHVDLTAVRGDSVLSDLAERDFTVNAMAVPLGEPDDSPAAVLDPFGGAGHLRERRLVGVSDHIFADDPLRLMRAARFCHTLGLKADADLVHAIEEQAPTLSAVAAERVMNEMCITLSVGRSAEAARLWSELGLLTIVLPELVQAGRAVDSNGFAHTLASLAVLDDIIEDPAAWFPETSDFLVARMAEAVDGAVTRPVALRLAVLMQGLSADEIGSLGPRLKLSSALTSLLTAMARCRTDVSVVGAEARTRALDILLPDGVETSREAVLFMWESAPWEPEAVLAAVIEAAAVDTGVARRLMALAVARTRGETPPLPVDGEVLMRELGLESGPVLGRALREAQLVWESGEATSRSAVLEVARRIAIGG